MVLLVSLASQGNDLYLHSALNILFLSLQCAQYIMYLYSALNILVKSLATSTQLQNALKRKCEPLWRIQKISKSIPIDKSVSPNNGWFYCRHTVRMMFGNGLRPQIWQKFVDRWKTDFSMWSSWWLVRVMSMMILIKMTLPSYCFWQNICFLVHLIASCVPDSTSSKSTSSTGPQKAIAV